MREECRETGQGEGRGDRMIGRSKAVIRLCPHVSVCVANENFQESGDDCL